MTASAPDIGKQQRSCLLELHPASATLLPLGLYVLRAACINFGPGGGFWIRNILSFDLGGKFYFVVQICLLQAIDVAIMLQLLLLLLQ